MRNGVRMISVVMGCQNGKRRFDEAARLLSLGFSQYKLVRFLEKGAPAAQAVPVLGGEKKDTVLTAAAEFVAAVKPADQPKVERKESLCPYLPAPVAPGTPCGKVSFVIGERELGAVDMITAESIPALSLTGKILRRLYLK
ncbi:MAG TPA: hypothetical protein PLP17_15230, partial [Oligoflexia bacterium]|nr:hypothetical protein [Oligoflexia bacterium]